MRRPLRRSFNSLCVLSLLACASGCVMIPQGTLADGTPTPSHEVARLLRERRLVKHKSSPDQVRTTFTAACDAAFRKHAYWWCVDQKDRRFALVYNERVRAYGITLNQHAFYFPFPMFGVEMELQAAIFFTFDRNGAFSGWHRQINPDLTGYEIAPEDAIRAGEGKATP